MKKLKILAAATALMCAALPSGAQVVNLYGQNIEDLQNLSQDPGNYWKWTLRGSWLSEREQNELSESAVKQFFRPWHSAGAPVPDLAGTENVLDGAPYTSSLTVRTEAQRRELVDAAQMNLYPTMDRRAVTVRFAACRVLPDMHPAFADPGTAGEGYPFDYLQNSGVHPGTPLRVLHADKSGGWYLCEYSSAAGWFRAEDIAFVSARFCRRYESGHYAAVVDDNTPLRSAAGRTLCTACIGAVFPTAGSGQDARLLIPLRASDGTAKIALIPVPEKSVRPYPVPFTAENMIAQARKFMGTLYGWGGLYGDRDCSMMVKDLTAPFGMMMPRNSRAQSFGSGPFIDLRKLSAAEKVRVIREKGLPFRSLIGFSGHIGLYLGLNAKGQPVMMHNLWGVALSRPENPGLSGRLVIGRTVITTLDPGAERTGLVVRGRLAERMTALTFLPGFGAEETVEKQR